MDLFTRKDESLKSLGSLLHAQEGKAKDIPTFKNVSLIGNLKQRMLENTVPRLTSLNKGITVMTNENKTVDISTGCGVRLVGSSCDQSKTTINPKSTIPPSYVPISQVFSSAAHFKAVSSYPKVVEGDLNETIEVEGSSEENLDASSVQEHRKNSYFEKTNTPSFNFLRSSQSSRVKTIDTGSPSQGVRLRVDIDTGLDYEEILNRVPSFNRYLEMKQQQREASKKPISRPKKVPFGGFIAQYSPPI